VLQSFHNISKPPYNENENCRLCLGLLKSKDDDEAMKRRIMGLSLRV
jgi:hypothetical protein